jgi:hypothetical protein
MNKQFFKDTFGWGFLLWLLGYNLGIILFMIAPPSIIGWVIAPIATVITVSISEPPKDLCKIFFQIKTDKRNMKQVEA